MLLIMGSMYFGDKSSHESFTINMDEALAFALNPYAASNMDSKPGVLREMISSMSCSGGEDDMDDGDDAIEHEDDDAAAADDDDGGVEGL